MSDGFLESFLSVGEDGPTLASSTSATSLLPVSRKITLPTYFFDRVGKRLRIVAAGKISTLATSPGTLSLDVRFGSVTVFAGGTMSLNANAKTNVGWTYTADLVCRSIGNGTAATVLGQGLWTSEAILGAPVPTAGGMPSHVLPFNTTPAAGSGFDSTAAQTIDFYGTWSVSNAANSITLLQFYVQSPT